MRDKTKKAGSIGKRNCLLQKEKELGNAITFNDIVDEVGGIYPKVMVHGDVEAGAYYRLNDRLRVGAAAAVAAPEADPARAPDTNGRAQPRVRLETIFKF